MGHGNFSRWVFHQHLPAAEQGIGLLGLHCLPSLACHELLQRHGHELLCLSQDMLLGHSLLEALQDVA